MIVSITVYGNPAPQGSKRFVGVSKKTGRGLMIESSKAVKPWRQDVVAAAREVMGSHPPLDGPIIASITFTLPKPTSAPKRRQTWPDRKPDLSKLLRSTEDALVTAGVISDDARIIGFHRLAKCYPNEGVYALASPGAVIKVWSASQIDAAP